MKSKYTTHALYMHTYIHKKHSINQALSWMFALIENVTPKFGPGHFSEYPF